MRRVRIVVLLCVLVAVCLGSSESPKAITQVAAVEVYFSPDGGCTDAIVREINSAQRTLLVQAYSFTSRPITKALVDAHKRGVRVHVILDSSQRRAGYSSAAFLDKMHVPTLIDGKHAVAHNNIMIVDKQTVITGSFDFTNVAEQRNAENLLVIRDERVAKLYTENWEAHRDHSVPYKRKPKAERAPQSKPTTTPATPRVVTPAPAPSVSSGVTVYVTRTGKKYHRSSCRYVRSGPIAMSLAEAKAKGYTPCKVCKPPE